MLRPSADAMILAVLIGNGVIVYSRIGWASAIARLAA